MSSHTPAPWRFIETGTANASVEIHPYCMVSGAYQGGDSDLLSHEDARLIAAAPELLAALKAFRAALPICRETNTPEVAAAFALATAAVAKAEGSK